MAHFFLSLLSKISAKPLPERFCERIRQMLPASEHEAFFEMCKKPLRKSIRVNTLKISVPEFQNLAKGLGWELQQIPWCESGFWIDRESHAVPLGKSWPYAAGLFYIQESSSMMPPEVLTPEKGDIVLDIAAAPGSKTTQLAAKLGNTGLVIANEPGISRMKGLSSNLERCGVVNTILSMKDGRAFPKYFPNRFDRILLDAPCTGEGTIRKSRNALDFWSEKGIEKLATLQKMLIVAAFHALAPGGEMTYSTCTLAPEENEGVVSHLLEGFPDNAEIVPIPGGNGIVEFEERHFDPSVAGTFRIWPHRVDAEGFFVAKIRKNEATDCEIDTASFHKSRSPFSRMSKGEERIFRTTLEERFGCTIELPDGYGLYLRDEEVWLRYEKVELFAGKLSLERTGNIVGMFKEGKMRHITHMGAEILVPHATKNVIELTEKELADYLGGRDLDIGEREGLSDWFVLVKYQRHLIGKGLLKSGKLKNQFPREFVVA